MKIKQLKKIILATLVGAFTLTALTACQKTQNKNTDSAESTSDSKTENQTTQDSSEIKLSMTWWGNQVRNERTQEALNKYNELNSNVTIDGSFFEWGDYWSKLATSAAGKELPDLIQMDISYIDQYVGKNQLLDLTPYIANGELDVSNLANNVLDMGKIGDGIYGIAAGVNAPALFYNKTLLEDNGFEIKDNMTLDEFITLSKEIYDKTGYKTNLIHYGIYMPSWARAEGIPIVEKKMGAEKAEDYEPYFKTLINGIDEGWHLSPEITAELTAIEQDPMIYGSSPETMSWCTMNGSNLLIAYQSAATEGVELGITSVPTSDPTKSNYLKPSMLFSISADTPNPDEAVKVLNYLINSIDANEILLGERGVPASSEIASNLFAMLSESDQAVFTYVNDVITPNCSPMDPPSPDGSSEVTDLLRKLEEKVGYGEVTPAEAAQEYFDQGNEIYSSK